MSIQNSDLLTVCVITYNHEKSIKKALDSILAQETDFDFKILVADDCSKDHTRSILSEYKKEHPSKIELILQEKNVGPLVNWTQLVTAPNSKYIAYLEGDDYWVDTHRLKNQLDLLARESSIDYCGAIAQVVKNGRETNMKYGDYAELANSDFVKEYRFFRLSSLVVRTDLMERIIDEYGQKILLCEYTINNLLFELGKGVYYKEIVSVYNVTGSGTWTGLSDSDRLKDHYSYVHPMRKHLKKNWSFFALQELVTFTMISAQDFKRNRSIDFFREHFFTTISLLPIFILRLGFITSIPQFLHWRKEKKKTAGTYN